MLVELRQPPVAKKGGRPKKPEPTRPIQVRVPESIAAALERMADSNRRTRTQEIMLAIEDRLKAEGFWPADEGETTSD